VATITLKGNSVHTVGNLPKIGDKAPEFLLTRGSLEDVRLADFAGKKKILNIVASLDTGICATSAKRFEQEAAALPDTVILTVSRDLPFAQKRFCEGAGIKNVITVSELRNRDFGQAYGVTLADGPMAGLLSRAVVVIDAQNKVVYTQQVPEIVQEPDYAPALEAAKRA
jgi:thiol peroxidase